MSLILTPSTTIDSYTDPIYGAPAPSGDDGDFLLDVTLVESAAPIAALRCDTSDGCGSTCSTSACNSMVNNPG